MSILQDSAGDGLNSEINVTPFVDVMLVLLIIFMVAAPMMTVGVPVELPKAALSELPPEQQKPLDIFIRRDGGIFFGDQPVADAALNDSLAALPEEQRAQRVRLRADRDVPYEKIMQVMEGLTRQGFSRVGLVAAPKPEPVTP